MLNIYSNLICPYLFLLMIKNNPLIVNYHVILSNEANYCDLSIMTVITLMLNYYDSKDNFYRICIYILF